MRRTVPIKATLTKLDVLKLVSCLLFVLVLILDNIKIAPLERVLRPVFDASLYPVGLEQDWNMFVGNQIATLAVRVENVYQNGRIYYSYSHMGQKPYLWPNKQRNIDWGLVAVDTSGAYRVSYLMYLCRQDRYLQSLTYEVAFLNIPTIAYPADDPFTDRPLYQELTTVRCN